MMFAFYRQLFSGLPREVWLLSLVTFVQRSGTMVLPFLTLYLTNQRGFSVREAGGVLSLYGVGAIGGSYMGGWLSDRMGSLNAQLFSMSLSAGVLLVLSRMQTSSSIMMMVMLLSILAEGGRPANAATLTELSPPSLHVRVFGLRRLGMNLGMSIGPAVGGVLVAHSYFLLFWVEASITFLAAGLLWLLFRHHRSRKHSPTFAQTKQNETPSSPNSPWRDGVFLAVVGLVAVQATVLCQLFGAYPLTLHQEYHLPEYTIGLVFTLNTLVIVVFQMPIVYAVERFDTLRVVGVGAFLLCSGFGLLALASSMGPIALTVLVWTLGEMLTMPLVEGFVAQRSPIESRGQYMGIFSAAFSIAFVLAPFGGTWVYEAWGYRILWTSCAVLGGGLWIAYTLLSTTVHRQREQERLSLDGQRARMSC